MWQRRLNWAAILLVGTFGLIWVGIMIYADNSSPQWMRAAQILFGLVLLGWAVQKAAMMITRDQGWKR
jgi:hypothetical protein